MQRLHGTSNKHTITEKTRQNCKIIEYYCVCCFYGTLLLHFLLHGCDFYSPSHCLISTLIFYPTPPLTLSAPLFELSLSLSLGSASPFYFSSLNSTLFYLYLCLCICLAPLFPLHAFPPPNSTSPWCLICSQWLQKQLSELRGVKHFANHCRGIVMCCLFVWHTWQHVTKLFACAHLDCSFQLNVPLWFEKRLLRKWVGEISKILLAYGLNFCILKILSWVSKEHTHNTRLLWLVTYINLNKLWFNFLN